jgi:hypothetical protein
VALQPPVHDLAADAHRFRCFRLGLAYLPDQIHRLRAQRFLDGPAAAAKIDLSMKGSIGRTIWNAMYIVGVLLRSTIIQQSPATDGSSCPAKYLLVAVW